jgi:hypothetical protein
MLFRQSHLKKGTCKEKMALRTPIINIEVCDRGLGVSGPLKSISSLMGIVLYVLITL